MPKNLNFEQLLKHILRVFPRFGGKFASVGLDHSGSQPFKCESVFGMYCSSVSITTYC